MKRLLAIGFTGVLAAGAIAAGAVLTVPLFSLHQTIEAAPMAITKAVAVVTPRSDSKVEGVITFTQVEDGVKVEAHITGLTPGQKHGFHIHEFGDITSADGKSTGGHFNPHAMDHAGPAMDMRHVGDMGNLEADDKGMAMYSRVDKLISLDMTSENCIIGRGIVVHAGTDDLKTQPTGDAGGRIGVAVIGVAKGE